jgi:putative heme-binding domain-containing protein
VLVSLSSGRLSSREARAAASASVDRAWQRPENAVPLLRAIGRLRSDPYALQVRGLMNDSRPEIAAAAKQAASQLRLETKKDANEPLLESFGYEQVLASVAQAKGEVRRGREVFNKAGCAACHTVSTDEPPKGPFLGGIATRYSRAELCESILKPSAKIAQGFETQWFETNDDEEYEGFVTREGGDDLDVRNIAGITTTLAKKNITERGHREISMMPPGLMDKLTMSDLAALLAYLESLKSN